VKNYAFLFWGYLIVWAGLMAYLVAIARKLASVSRRLDALDARANRGGAGKAI
jgi:CcmD family protein